MHKILLVEDDEVIRQQVKKMLEQWGYEVVLVEDFMEVLSIFVKVEQSPTWFLWILVYLYSTVIIGVRKFVRFPRCLLCSCLPETRPWILLWQSTWVGTIL